MDGVKAVMLNSSTSILPLEVWIIRAMSWCFFEPLFCSSVGLWIYKNVSVWLREVITALCLKMGEASSGILYNFGPHQCKRHVDKLETCWQTGMRETTGGLLRCNLLQPFIHMDAKGAGFDCSREKEIRSDPVTAFILPLSRSLWVGNFLHDLQRSATYASMIPWKICSLHLTE